MLLLLQKKPRAERMMLFGVTWKTDTEMYNFLLLLFPSDSLFSETDRTNIPTEVSVMCQAGLLCTALAS